MLAYPGQFIAVVGTDNVVGYLITVAGAGATLQKLAATTSSGDITEDLNKLTTRVGNLETAVGKQANGDEAATGLYKYVDDAVKAAAPADYDTVKGKVNTLIGDDAGKSARTIAGEEVAKIVGDAPEAYDTLVEIATWITDHADSASAMNAQITANKTAIETLNGTGAGSVSKTVDDKITALDLANTYAAKAHTHVVADITDLDTTLAGYQPKGDYATTSQVNTVSAKLGTLPEGTATLVDYVDNKVQDAAGATTTLKNTVDALIGEDKDKTIREIAEAESKSQITAAGVSAEKVAKWDSALQGITAGGETVVLADGIAQIPAATAEKFGVVKVDNSSLEAANGVVGIKAVNVSKLFVAEGEEFVLNGGNA